ncbi:MAG: helix-turn-helix transcriptional regulator [Lepagella sp.]
MTQLQKYTWLIDTIRYAVRISHKDLSERWERNRDMSDGKPLSRATFNRWRDAIFDQFGISIECQKEAGYLYFIANPEDIDQNRLKKWMLDSFAVSNTIRENLALKGRILVDEIPSGRNHFTTILEAMKENRRVMITYHPFNQEYGYTFPIEPYCIKLFEKRWYVLGRNNRGNIRVYGLDRLDESEMTEETFKMPKGFDAADFFATTFGIVIGHDMKPERIVIRAYGDHKHYMRSLPLHPSQELVEEQEDYADFKLYLAPTYDFVMKLLQAGAMVEVISPATLRREIKGWIADMSDLYREDNNESTEE